MFHHTPVTTDKENQHSQGPIKQVLRCKTPHRRPLGIVNSSDTLGNTPSNVVLSSKKLSTNYQTSHSPNFTPVRSQKKQSCPPKTPCILADESWQKASIAKHKEANHRIASLNSEEASLKLNISAEKKNLTPEWDISDEVNNTSSAVDEDVIAEYVNSIIQKQLSLLQDEVEESVAESYTEKDGTSSVGSLSFDGISEKVNLYSELDRHLLPETDNTTHSPQHGIRRLNGGTCSFSNPLFQINNQSLIEAEFDPAQFEESPDVSDLTSLLFENNTDQTDNCDTVEEFANLSCQSVTEETLEASAILQSTSLHVVDVSDRSFGVSSQWQLDEFSMITTRDTASVDRITPFQATFCPVEMKDGSSQTSPKHQYVDYDSPAEEDALSNRISLLKKERTMKTLSTKLGTMDFAVNTTPVKLVNGFSQMSPVSSKEESTTTTPHPELVFADSSTDFTPKKLMDGMSQMTPKSWQDQETCTTTVANVVMVDESVNVTPAAMKSMASQMTPCSFKDQFTAITPHQASDATTCTSPLVNINLNFDQSENQKDPVLISQLETAAICNEILRQDIQSLENKMQGMRNEVKEKEQDVIQATNNLAQKEQYFKTSHQKLIDGLQIQIEEHVKQIGSLEVTLHQKSDNINSMEADISCMRAHYQKQIQNLQQDLCRSYRQHKKEAETMKEEINQNANLKEELQTARDHVQELEESLKAFSHLKGSLEEGDQVQEEMECLNDYYAGLEVLIRQMEDECKKYQEENLMMKVKMEENDARISNALDKASESNEYISELRMELELTKAERSQLEELYNKASFELGVATHQYSEFLAVLDSAKTELEQYKDTVRSLQEHQSLQDQKAVESCLQEMCLEASLIVQTNQACRQQAQSKVVIAELQAANDKLNEKCSELQSAHEVEMQKLHSRLGELEEENHHSRRRISDQFQEIKDNFQAKAQLYETKQSMKKMEEKYKESQEFVEEECNALNEALDEKDGECQSVILELSRYKVALYTKQEEIEELQEGVEMLRQQLMDCESELDNTKANAHLMLLNQLSEMADASNEIASLESHMITAFNSLMVSQDLQNDQLQTPERTDEFFEESGRSDMQRQTSGTEYQEAAEVSSATSPSGASLVASILHAMHGSMDDFKEQPCVSDTETETCECEAELQESVIVGSNGSAFTAFKPVEMQEIEANTTYDGDADTGESSSMKQKSSLGDLVRAASSVFEKLLGTMKDKEMELTNKKEEIAIERQIMEAHLKKTIGYYECEHQQLKERLQESECREQRLHQNLQSKFSELANQNMIMQYGQQQLDAMATKLDSLSDMQIENKHLKEETDKLQNLLKGSNMQRDLLEKEMAHIMQRLDDLPSTGSQSGLDVTKVMQDNISLKKEMEKLKLHVMEKNDYYENLNSRATRQMKTLKENWKKAEDEILQLDTILDLCRKHVTNIPASLSAHHSIQGLHALFKD